MNKRLKKKNQQNILLILCLDIRKTLPPLPQVFTSLLVFLLSSIDKGEGELAVINKY